MTRYARPAKKQYEEASGSDRQRGYGGASRSLIPKKSDAVKQHSEAGHRAAKDGVGHSGSHTANLRKARFEARKQKRLEKQQKQNGNGSDNDNDNDSKLIRGKPTKSKSSRKTVCFHCRKIGHSVGECPDAPESVKTSSEENTGAVSGICFKCGSSEHTARQCRKKTDDFKFAMCFICRQQGHISAQCPQNEKGLYPNGGGCAYCGSVQHLARDCISSQKSGKEAVLGTIEAAQGGDDDDLFASLHKMQREIKTTPSTLTKRKQSSHNESAPANQRTSATTTTAPPPPPSGNTSGHVKKKAKVVTF